MPLTNSEVRKVFDKEKILSQAKNLRHDKRHGTFNKKEDFQKKYNYLHEYFPDLFDMIYEDPDNHDTLEMTTKIVSLADMYHNKKLTFDDSSRKAGQVLFDKFYTEKKNGK